MLKTGTIHVILNAGSGLDSKKDTPAVLDRIFREAGFDSQIKTFEKGFDLCAMVREAVRDGAGIVVAGGGDGTMNAVASVLAGTDIPMGVLPIGTLNHFARDLNIPLDVEQAARVIVENRAVQVDVGEVNGRTFINNAIIGLYPIYRNQRERNEQRGRHKLQAMVTAVFTVLMMNPFLRVRSRCGEGQMREYRTPLLMVGNNRHEMEGYNLGTRHTINDGRLWLYVMRHLSRLGLMRLVISLIFGQFTKEKDFDVESAPEIVVESRRKRIGISLDGEVVRMDLPLHYKVRPGALHVIVPATYPTPRD